MNDRQRQILKLIRSRPIHTQQDLGRALAALGMPATQATLSRDIKALRLAKSPAGYVQLAAAPEPGRFTALARELLEGVRVAQNLIVLRTPPGKANALAVELDRENWPDVVGTIAGDDTILVVCPDSPAAAALAERLAAL